VSAYQVLIAVGVIAFAYLLGSLNFAVIMSRIFTGEDVRKSGSGNAGATNVLRTAGKLPAILTPIGEKQEKFLSIPIIATAEILLVKL